MVELLQDAPAASLRNSFPPQLANPPDSLAPSKPQPFNPQLAQDNVNALAYDDLAPQGVCPEQDAIFAHSIGNFVVTNSNAGHFILGMIIYRHLITSPSVRNYTPSVL